MATALQLDPGAVFAGEFRVSRRLVQGGKGAVCKSAHVEEGVAAGVVEATQTPCIARALREGDDLAPRVRPRGPRPAEGVLGVDLIHAGLRLVHRGHV